MSKNLIKSRTTGNTSLVIFFMGVLAVWICCISKHYCTGIICWSHIYTSRPCHQNAIEPSTLFNQVSQRVERVHFWVFLIGAITISGVRIYAITIQLFQNMPLQFQVSPSHAIFYVSLGTGPTRRRTHTVGRPLWTHLPLRSRV